MGMAMVVQHCVDMSAAAMFHVVVYASLPPMQRIGVHVPVMYSHCNACRTDVCVASGSCYRNSCPQIGSLKK